MRTATAPTPALSRRAIEFSAQQSPALFLVGWKLTTSSFQTLSNIRQRKSEFTDLKRSVLSVTTTIRIKCAPKCPSQINAHPAARVTCRKSEQIVIKEILHRKASQDEALKTLRERKSSLFMLHSIQRNMKHET